MPRPPIGERTLTPAERQRRHRDRKRGGPPVGRWPEGSQTTFDPAQGFSRVTQWKGQVLQRERPDLADKVVAGRMSIERAFRLHRHEAEHGLMAETRARLQAELDAAQQELALMTGPEFADWRAELQSQIKRLRDLLSRST